MVCMAGLQVFIVRFFFQGARKGEFGNVMTWGWKDLLTGVFRICMNNGQGALESERVIVHGHILPIPIPHTRFQECHNRPDYGAAFTKQSTALLQCAPTI